MKLAKAMKKLKFWSSKNKKPKKLHYTKFHHHLPPPPPPPPPCQCRHSWAPPSAPPLPPWFEFDQPISYEPVEEIVPENHVSSSYQQYMVPNPVYGVPVLPVVRTEKSAGKFGCVVSVGRHLIRCFFPCFHIREVK